ncbi:MAG: nickel-dependent lactate racemase [Desulfobacteraceae bacterium]|nr:MAG: nickel-dependent lactate racemase [Desulfobacteraceae bacterium]
MTTYAVPNGNRMIELKVPGDVEVTLVSNRDVPVIQDVKEAIRDAILHPVASKRLSSLVRPGQKAAVIVTDVTRKLPEEIILPLLIEELRKGGIGDEDITFIVATGTHRPNTTEEMAAKFGPDLVRRFRFINHNAWEPQGLKNMGTSRRGIPLIVNREAAEADVRISTGVIETHLFAGYSGGVKSLAVGVAGEATIAATHNYEMIRNGRLGIIENNPFREFLTEAASAVGLDFIVNCVQTGKKELVQVVAGHPVAAFEEGVSTARSMVEVELEHPGDILVTGVSSPKNRDLYQATRAANTSVFGPRPAVTKGGVLLIPATCEDGFGKPGYVDWMSRCNSAEEIIRSACDGFAPGDQKALILGWILNQARIVMTDCMIPAGELSRIHLESAPTLQQAFDLELKRRPHARVVIIPDALLSLPIVREADLS